MIPTTIRRTCVLALGAMLWVGCDEKKQPATPPPTAPPPPDVTPKAGGVGGAIGGASAGKSGGGGIATTEPSTTQTPDPKSAAAKADPAVAPVASAKEAEQSKQAQDLISSAIQAIKENRLDDAEAALTKVEGMNASLPTTTQEQLKSVRGNLQNVRKLQTPDVAGAATDPDNK